MAWQIYEITNSPLELGLLELARGAPMLELLLFGGHLDRPFATSFVLRNTVNQSTSEQQRARRARV